MWQYNKIRVGERIRKQRRALGMTQENLAEHIGKSTKYCADVERGNCGMAIDAMLKICEALALSPNMLLVGEAKPDAANDLLSIEALLARCTPAQREKAIKMLRLLLDQSV